MIVSSEQGIEAQAYLLLWRAVTDKWAAWSDASPRNAKLAKIARRLSGLGEWEDTLCVNQPPDRAPKCGRWIAPKMDFAPAWTAYLIDADQALKAIEEASE